jgi:hypothetical protein
LKPGAAGNYLQVNNYLGKQYGMRVVVAIFWLSSTTGTITMTALDSTATSLYSKDIWYNTSSISTTNGTQYCTGSSALNFDSGVFNRSTTPYVTIKFSAPTGTVFGIR